MPTIDHNPQNDTIINRNLFPTADSPDDSKRDVDVTTSFICCCSLGVDERLDTSARAITRTSLLLSALLMLFLTYTGIAAGVSVFVILATRQPVVICAFMLSIWILWLLCTLGIGYLIAASIHTLVRQIILRNEEHNVTSCSLESTQDQPVVIPPPPDVVPSPLTPSKPVPYHSMMRRWNMQSLDVTFEFAEKHIEMMHADIPARSPLKKGGSRPNSPFRIYTSPNSGADGIPMRLSIPLRDRTPSSPKTPIRSPQVRSPMALPFRQSTPNIEDKSE